LRAGVIETIDVPESAAVAAPAVPPPKLVVEPDSATKPAAATAPPAFPLRRGVGFGLLGASVAALGAAVVLGAQDVAALDAYNAAPSEGGARVTERLTTWTNAAWVGAALLAAGGLVLLFWPQATPTQRALAAGRVAF
jgi:hypothetical protein